MSHRHVVDNHEARARRYSTLLAAAVLTIMLYACTLGAFRVDDWLNLERGRWAVSPSGWLAVWTETNPFSLFRPLVDYWHGAMFRVFGLEPGPMLLALVLLMAVASLLLARLARERTGSRSLAALTLAAVWSQPNTYAWTALWVSNVTAALLAVFSLAALLEHHRAVRHAHSGKPVAGPLARMIVWFLAGALCKEEIVLLPGGLIALEWARWPELDSRQRRTALRSIVLLGVAAMVYAAIRLTVFPPPPSGNRYHLALDAQALASLRFYGMHLGALPAVALALSLALFPAMRSAQTWTSPQGRRALREAAGAFAWAGISLLLYFSIQGRPAYGYLYMPAFAVAYGTAVLLSQVASRDRAHVRGTLVIALHALLATTLTAAALHNISWHTYREVTREVFATLDRELPAPPPGALIAFLDPDSGDTNSYRSVFNFIFAEFTPSAVNLHYGRNDLRASVVRRPEELPADAVMTFVARRGLIERIANAPATVPPLR